MDLSISSSIGPEMKVSLGPGGHCPVKATDGAVGFDLTIPKTIRISPGVVYCIDTEVAVQLPEGYGGFLKARSSYAAKGLMILGGVIDSDYRGYIQVLVSAVADDSILLVAGQRFVQIVPFLTGGISMNIVTELTPTQRGTGMLGSTTQQVQETQNLGVDDDDEDEDDDDTHGSQN